MGKWITISDDIFSLVELYYRGSKAEPENEKEGKENLQKYLTVIRKNLKFNWAKLGLTILVLPNTA